MTSIIDVSFECGAKANDLAAAGVRTVFRYYSRNSKPGKCLTAAEANQLNAAGLRIGAICESALGNKPGNFNRADGIADGQHSRTYATHVIGQPTGSTIYFAVDTDQADLEQQIIPYFEGVNAAFAADSSENDYIIGLQAHQAPSGSQGRYEAWH